MQKQMQFQNNEQEQHIREAVERKTRQVSTLNESTFNVSLKEVDPSDLELKLLDERAKNHFLSQEIVNLEGENQLLNAKLFEQQQMRPKQNNF